MAARLVLAPRSPIFKYAYRYDPSALMHVDGGAHGQLGGLYPYSQILYMQ